MGRRMKNDDVMVQQSVIACALCAHSVHRPHGECRRTETAKGNDFQIMFILSSVGMRLRARKMEFADEKIKHLFAVLGRRENCCGGKEREKDYKTIVI